MRTARKCLGLAMALVFAVLCPAASAIGFSAEEIYGSVFVIETDSAIGSGFAISEKEVVTNAHVISNGHKISVVTYEGSSLSARVTAYDEDLDLAILYVADATFIPLPFDSLDAIHVGDDVYAIGAPKSMSYSLTKGIISSKDRVIRNRHYIQIDAAVNEGNSGGPLLDANGNVLGVITLKMTNAEGIGLAIPITVVTDWMDGIDTSPPAATEISPNTTLDDNTEDPQEPSYEGSPQYVNGTNKVNAALVIALTLSLLLNIVFAIFIGLSRKKNKPGPKPSPDRTDFEIEFEE